MSKNNMEIVEVYERLAGLGLVEATSTVAFDGKSFSKINRKQFYNHETKKYRVFSQSGFIKVYTGNGRHIADVIESDQELGKMTRIMRCIDVNNMIVYNAHSKHESYPANRELLRKMTGLKGDRSARFISKMTKLGIIREAKIGDAERFFINPIYTMADSGITLTLYKLFREELVEVLPDQVIKDLDFLVYLEQNPDVIEAIERYEEALKAKKEKEGIVDENDPEVENIAMFISGNLPEEEFVSNEGQEVDEEAIENMETAMRWSKMIDGCYVGPKDGISKEDAELIFDAVYEYLHSEKTKEDKEDFLSKVGEFYRYRREDSHLLTFVP